MMLFKHLTIGVAAISSVGSASTAATYVSQQAFLAAHGNAVTTSFDTTYKPYNSYRHLASGEVVGPLTVTGSSLLAVRKGYQYATMAYLRADNFGGNIGAGFASSQALGFFLATSTAFSYPVAFTVLNGSKVVFTKTLIGGGTRSGFTYFGLDGIGAFTSFKLDAGAYTNADAPAFAAVSLVSATGARAAFAPAGTAAGDVPEPASWALLTVGFGFVGVATRRRAAARTEGGALLA